MIKLKVHSCGSMDCDNHLVEVEEEDILKWLDDNWKQTKGHNVEILEKMSEFIKKNYE